MGVLCDSTGTIQPQTANIQYGRLLAVNFVDGHVAVLSFPPQLLYVYKLCVVCHQKSAGVAARAVCFVLLASCSWTSVHVPSHLAVDGFCSAFSYLLTLDCQSLRCF